MWITLTPADLNGSLGAAEVAKLTAVAGNGDTRVALLGTVTTEIRGYAGTAGPLGPTGTIPDELKDAAVSIAVWRYVTQLPTKNLVTDARKDANDRAVTLLRDVAAGKFRVVPPENAAPQTQQAPRPGVATIQAGNTGNSREDLSRL